MTSFLRLRSLFKVGSESLVSKSDKNNFSKILLSSSIAATANSSNLITTAGGYTLSASSVTLLSNAPLLAFAFVQVSGLQPIKDILKTKQTGKLSPFPFISLYTNCGIWSLYGYLQSDNTILYANVAGTIMGLIYTGLFHSYTHINMSKFYMGSTAILLPMLSSPQWLGINNSVQLLGSFGCISAIILMASPLATVKTVIAEKSTESMPFTVSLAMTLNGFAWGNYGWIVASDPYVYVPNILGFSSGLIQLSLFAIYRKR